MANCIKCKAPIEDGTKFCDACGTEQPQTLFCENCGKKLENSATFCDACGTLVGAAKKEPAASAAQAEKEAAAQKEREAAVQREKEAMLNDAKKQAKAEADRLIASAQASANQIKATAEQQAKIELQQPAYVPDKTQTLEQNAKKKKKYIKGIILFIVFGTLAMILWAWMIEAFF